VTCPSGRQTLVRAGLGGPLAANGTLVFGPPAWPYAGGRHEGPIGSRPLLRRNRRRHPAGAKAVGVKVSEPGDTAAMEALFFIVLAVFFFAVAGYQFSRRRRT
jgi:hypothetical protein